MFTFRLLSASALIGLAAALAFTACGGGSAAQPTVGCNGGSLRVAVTFPLFADFACRIGGERVTVTALIPPQANPHTYQPPLEAAQTVREARLILYNSPELDGPALDFIRQHAAPGAQIIGYALSIPSPTAPQPAEGEPPVTAQAAGDNPHLWLDVELAKLYVTSTADSLAIVDPDGAPTFHQNAAAFLAELEALSQKARWTVESLPPERRRLVPYHDAFDHFARRYGLELLGPIVADPGAQPTTESLEGLAQQVREGGVPAVFAEVGLDRAPVQRLAEMAGVQVCSLYSDIIDAEAQTYLEMMRANLQEIERCLGGD